MSESDADSQPTNRSGAAAATGGRLRYRLFTGQDTAEFCERVSDALADGYVLYGSPIVTFDPDQGTRIAAQAVILPD